MTTSRLPSRLLTHALLAVVALAFILPLVWMVATSLKTDQQAASGEIRFLPDPASSALPQAAANYSAVWTDPSVTFPVYFRNTLIVAILSVIGMTLSSAFIAYGLSRINWRGRNLVFISVLATMMIPFPVLMTPLFLIFKQMDSALQSLSPSMPRLVGNLTPLWLPAWFGGAFNIFLLRQFYSGIPKELDEAARIDGCSHWRIFWRIIVPLSAPALGVVALFHFIYVWNDFLGPLIFLHDNNDFTLAQGLQLYQSKAGLTPWNLLMAASTMVIAPVLLLFMIAQRSFVGGVATEGLKG